MLSQRSVLRRRALGGAVTAVAVITLGACGGGNASPSTTLQPLGPTNFATIPPVDDTTPVGGTDVENPIPSEEVYTVQAGDVLFSIADKFGVSAQEIADYNEWEDGINHAIFPGDPIKIPGGARPVTTDQATTETDAPVETDPPDTTLAPGEGGTYEVQAGDYLAGIASKFDTTAQAIADANGWSDGINHAIFPGDVINLP